MNAQSALLCLVAAIILTVGLALQGGRYSFHSLGGVVLRMDRWTGTVELSPFHEGKWSAVGE
jgi:hypothetical protein